MNDLEKLFYRSSDRWSTKWEHYFEIYDRHFSKYRSTDVHILEFGIYQGGSLQVWKNYFGDRCHIYGVDINPACKNLEEDQVKIFIGDQQDRNFLQSLKKEIPRVDILIDDGGHKMEQQITTFEEMYAQIDEEGIYMCEDLHTSYWPRFGGGMNKPITFINYSKKLIDKLNSFHLDEGSTSASTKEFCKTTHSLHFYDSILVIEKRPRSKPKEVEAGTFNEKFPDHHIPDDSKKTFWRRVKKFIKRFLSYLD